MTSTSSQKVINVIKPQIDDRDYRFVVLENDLRALVISDPNTKKAAASLDVNVGHFQDPATIPGLAHFLEHMLFLGTEKYPEDTAFNEFLSSHGGSSNAYTGSSSTNYHFEVMADYFEEGLDRFSQFFTAPLFNPNAVEREIHAVDSEDQKNKQSDGHRFYQLQKSSCNPEHPFHKFSVGNLQTLHHIPLQKGIDIRAELLKFHETYYSASCMALAVLGKEPLDTLENWVRTKFSNIRNNGRKPLFQIAPETQQTLERDGTIYPFGPNEKGFLYKIVPVKDSRSLKLAFPTPALSPFYLRNPSALISHLIGHEGKGSLLELLKKKSWADGLSCGRSRINFDFELFSIDITLTEDGIHHVEEILQLVFQYIWLVKQSQTAITKWRYEELRQMSTLNFQFKQKRQAADTVETLSSQMQQYLPEHTLCGPYWYIDYDSAVTTSFLQYLVPTNLNVFVIARNFKGQTDKKEFWYGTDYSVEQISSSLLEKFQSIQQNDIHNELYLPQPNEFIPKDVQLKTSIEVQQNVGAHGPAPVRIRNDSLLDIWHLQDTQFKVPKANFLMNIVSPGINTSPKNYVMALLATELFEDELNVLTYDASLAGLSFSFQMHVSKLKIGIEGYNDRLPLLADAIFRKLADFKVNPERFVIFKQQIQRRYINFWLDPPHKIASYWLEMILKENKWSTEEKELSLKDVTVDDLQMYWKQLFSETFLEVFMHGNYQKDETLHLMDNVCSFWKAKPLFPSQYPLERIIKLPAGTFVFRSELPNDQDNNSAVKNVYLVGPENTKEDVLLDLLNEIFSTQFYDILRTKEQLGYIVWSGIFCHSGVQGFRIEIQSPKFDPHYLDQRIENAIIMCRETLLKLTQEEFQKYVTILTTQKLEKDKKLSELTSRFWSEINRRKFVFDRATKEVQTLEGVTLNDVIAFFDKYIADPSTRSKLSVQIFAKKYELSSKDFTESDQKSNSTVITNILQFKHDMPLFPAVY